MDNSNFCSIPWIHSATKPNGASRVCCLMSNHDTGGGGQTGHNFKTDTIEEICAKYNAKEETLTTLSDIVDEKYDEIYEKFNTSIDGYIKKVQFYSLIMCVLEIYKPDLYEFEGISPPPKKNST